MVWNHSVATKTACVRTAHTLHLNLKVCVARSGRVRGVATHAAGMDAGYGLIAVLVGKFAVDDGRGGYLHGRILCISRIKLNYSFHYQINLMDFEFSP